MPSGYVRRAPPTPVLMTPTRSALLLTVGLLGVASGFSTLRPGLGPVSAVARQANPVAVVNSTMHQPEKIRRRKGGRNRRRHAGQLKTSTAVPATAASTTAVIGTATSTAAASATATSVAATCARQRLTHIKATTCSRFQLVASALRPLRRAVLDPFKTRRLLREAWRRAAGRGVAMDSSSIDHSIVRCSNDFELVTRAVKELDHLLETHFKAPPGKAVALPEKIRLARTANGEPLSLDLQTRMKHLVKARNALVHKRHENAIRDRRAFRRELKGVLRELAVELERDQVPAPAPRNVGRSYVITEFRAAARIGARAGRGRGPSDDVYRA